MSLKDLPSIIAGTLTGAAVGLGIGVGVLLIWPLVWPAHPDATLRLDGGRLVGEASGRVDRIDPDARSVSVSASLFRLRETVFQVTDDTVIVVRGKPGGIGDLADASVRVSYELRGPNRVASLIEVGSSGAATAATTFEPSAAPAAADASETPKGSAPAAGVPAATTPAPEPTIPMPPPHVVEERSEPSPGVASTVVPAPRPPATGHRASTAPAAPSRGASELARSRPASRPAIAGTSDGADGASAVEWLLQDARHR